MKRNALAIISALILGGCSVFSKPTSQALPTVVLDSSGSASGGTTSGGVSQVSGSGVIASGTVVPAQEAPLAFPLAGLVETLAVEAGDQVEAGQVLARLAGSEKLAAAVEAARLELLAAQQALETLSDDMDVRQAQAWEGYLAAREAYSDTLETRNNLASLANSPSAKTARAELESALALVRRLRKYYDSLPGNPDTNPDKARALFELKLARLQAQAAQKKVDQFGDEPDPTELEQAEADVALAEARLAKARRDFEAIQAGPDSNEVELAEARLSATQAQLASAEAAREDLELRAPFGGTVTTLTAHQGVWVNPGQTVLVLTDLQDLQIETTDLSELDVPQIEIGQPVMVTIKALGQEVPGQVSDIAPLAGTLGGDVVYKTTIALETQPEGLRAGMSVEVRFGE